MDFSLNKWRIHYNWTLLLEHFLLVNIAAILRLVYEDSVRYVDVVIDVHIVTATVTLVLISFLNVVSLGWFYFISILLRIVSLVNPLSINRLILLRFRNWNRQNRLLKWISSISRIFILILTITLIVPFFPWVLRRIGIILEKVLPRIRSFLRFLIPIYI